MVRCGCWWLLLLVVAVGGYYLLVVDTTCYLLLFVAQVEVIEANGWVFAKSLFFHRNREFVFSAQCSPVDADREPRTVLGVICVPVVFPLLFGWLAGRPPSLLDTLLYFT